MAVVKPSHVPKERYAVTQDTIVARRQPGKVEDLLIDVLRQGARKLLAQAVKAEAAEFRAAFPGEIDALPALSPNPTVLSIRSYRGQTTPWFDGQGSIDRIDWGETCFEKLQNQRVDRFYGRPFSSFAIITNHLKWKVSNGPWTSFKETGQRPDIHGGKSSITCDHCLASLGSRKLFGRPCPWKRRHFHQF